VALGPVGWNLGAGMTGGVAYLREWNQLNADFVAARAVPAEDEAELRALVEEHARLTGSRRARLMLEDWPSAVAGFRQVVPIERARAGEAPPLQGVPDGVEDAQVGDGVLEAERRV
jgi:glutamate synthase (NADPH/NADH) large chain